MKRSSLIILFFCLAGINIYAQHQNLYEKPTIWRGKLAETEDTTSLLHAFKIGTAHGHFRHFFSATDNASDLQDYYANASGGGLRFESSLFHGFQVGISGFFIFNTGSSDLTKVDSQTNQANRYEIGLFDITDFHNKNDIDRLEEFFIKYSYQKTSLSFGKILVNTPMINLQDGRMRPTGVEGWWLESIISKKLRFEGGFLYGFSPRSTVDWYRGAASIGVYPTGINPDGSQSNYTNNLNSRGVLVGGLHYKLNPNISFHGWNYTIDNIMNSALLQSDIEIPVKNNRKFILGMQAIRQDAIRDGGNSDQSKTYVIKGNKSYTFGAKIGLVNKRTEITINYNRITAHGRYLFPREWGRDPFFTFMPRERSEGFGDVHTFIGRIGYQFPKIRLKANLAGGYVKLPDVRNTNLNKYGLPSYAQINADMRYSLGGVLTGVDFQLLIVHKKGVGNVYNNPRFVFNKVDMWLYNLILNYHF